MKETIAFFLAVLCVLFVVLGLAHLVRAGSNVIDFLFDYKFKIRVFHVEHDGCEVHTFKTEEERQDKVISASQEGKLVLKANFWCFTANMFYNLLLLIGKFVIAIMFGTLSAVFSCRSEVPFSYSMRAGAAVSGLLALLRGCAFIRTVIYIFRASDTFWEFLGYAFSSARFLVNSVIFVVVGLIAIYCACSNLDYKAPIFFNYLYHVNRNELEKIKKIENEHLNNGQSTPQPEKEIVYETKTVYEYYQMEQPTISEPKDIEKKY